MARVIRFHLDEHIDSAVADGLSRRGISVTTTAGAGLLGASDEEHLAFARGAEGRVLFTQDADFLRLHAAGAAHAGIVYCRQQSRPVGAILRDLILIWEILEPEEMRGRVEFL
jgi:predicted nuclease of predicted toxin-antitoxin system